MSDLPDLVITRGPQFDRDVAVLTEMLTLPSAVDDRQAEAVVVLGVRLAAELVALQRNGGHILLVHPRRSWFRAPATERLDFIW